MLVPKITPKYFGYAVTLILCALSVNLEVFASPVSGRLANVKNFAFALGSGVLENQFERLKQYDLVVIDGQDGSRAQIRELKAAGVIVLGYLSIGTLEPGRPWYTKAKKYRLDFWKDFGEYYADTSKSSFRNLILSSVLPSFTKKGFDGIFIDNVDMIREHKYQRKGMNILVKQIASYLHKQKRLVFAQNGEDVLGNIFKSLDGWNREDVSSTYDFDTKSYERIPQNELSENLKTLARIKRKGIFVTAADYSLTEDSNTIAFSHENACSVGAVSFVSTIELDSIPTTPYICP